MQVSAKDSIAFWKLYDEYEAKRKTLGKKELTVCNNMQTKIITINSQTQRQANLLPNHLPTMLSTQPCIKHI